LANKTRILVIDDDLDTLDATRLTLESRGYEVATTANPEDGLRGIEKDRPDLVILDVMMPDGIEGFQWLWNVRRHPDEAVRTVPVIVASSIHKTTPLRFHEGDSDETGSYLPVQGFFDKPVDPDQLVERIEKVLSESK